MKPGFKTSEFWLTLAATVAGALVPVAQAGPLTAGTAAPVLLPIALKLLGVTLPASVYAYGRSMVKSANAYTAAASSPGDSPGGSR